MKKFLVSTADVYGYDDSGNILFAGKTLLDSSIETTLANQDVRAGRGNQLQYVYYHTAEMNLTINDAQFNLDMLAVGVGQTITTGANVYREESVTLTTGGAGTVTGTPLAYTGTTIYGWVTNSSGVTTTVTFTGQAFTLAGGASGDVVTVRYYALDSAARSLTVRADMIPSVVRLVLEAQLCSSDVSTNKIGTVQIIVPKATLTGAFTISMTPDGVASTPLSARALSSVNSLGVPVYATINEVITGTHWYDDVIGLAIVGGDFSLKNGSTQTLDVRAIPKSGAAFKPPYADLTFTSGTTGVATVGANTGVVTAAAATGTSLLKVVITAVNTIEASATVTATA